MDIHPTSPSLSGKLKHVESGCKSLISGHHHVTVAQPMALTKPQQLEKDVPPHM
jgi:hypothetical protein